MDSILKIFPEDKTDKFTELQTKEMRWKVEINVHIFIRQCRKQKKEKQLVFFHTSSFISTTQAINPPPPPLSHTHSHTLPGLDTWLTCRAFSSTLCRRQTSATTITPSLACSLALLSDSNIRAIWQLAELFAVLSSAFETVSCSVKSLEEWALRLVPTRPKRHASFPVISAQKKKQRPVTISAFLNWNPLQWF